MEQRIIEVDGAANNKETTPEITPATNNDGVKSQEKRNGEINEIPKNQYIQDALRNASSLSYSINEFKKRLQKYIPTEEFSWPDDRSETENAIIQLKEKQILVIRGIISDWFNWAPQRIACVLQASINKLWPGCGSVYRIKDENTLSFGFWKQLEQFEDPIILLVPGNEVIEYLRNFILADYDKAYYDFKETLKAKNIFLIILVPDNDATSEILKKDEPKDSLKELFGSWHIPAIKLEIHRKKRKDGDLLYNKITNEFKLSGRDQRKIYKIIKEEDLNDDDAILQIIREEIQIENTASELIGNACNEDTELKLRMIYSGAFFNEHTPADFNRITSYLLNSQTEEIRSDDRKYVEKKPLNDIWLKPSKLDRIMSESMLAVKFNGKIRRVGFTRQVEKEDLQEYFLKHRYTIFLTLAEELIKQDLLFNKNLSEELKTSVIKLYALVIRDNYNNYDGEWLYRAAIIQAIQLYSTIQDEETLKLIELSERIQDKSILDNALKPLKGILKELLLNDQEHLTLIVKQFFEKLMDSGLKKNVAIGLAIDLYKELQETGNFPEEELDKYFKQALNVKDFEEKFYAYRMMVKNLYYKDLFKKTSDWLANDKSDDEPWTAKFSWLYKLDFCILTFHIHFQINEAKKDYELFTIDSEIGFNDDFKQLLKDITSTKCISSWHELLQHEDLFKYKFELLEKTVTNISILRGREDEQNRTPSSLAGDVLENWFYILYLEDMKEDNPNKKVKLKEYAALLTEVIDVKVFTELESYWRRKANNIYSNTIIDYKNNHEMEEKERDERISKLKTRRDSLDLLIELI